MKYICHVCKKEIMNQFHGSSIVYKLYNDFKSVKPKYFKDDLYFCDAECSTKHVISVGQYDKNIV